MIYIDRIEVVNMLAPCAGMVPIYSVRVIIRVVKLRERESTQKCQKDRNSGCQGLGEGADGKLLFNG